MTVASMLMRGQTLANRAQEEAGQTLAEYAILLAFIALVALVVVALLGSNVSGLFNSVATALP